MHCGSEGLRLPSSPGTFVLKWLMVHEVKTFFCPAAVICWTVHQASEWLLPQGACLLSLKPPGPTPPPPPPPAPAGLNPFSAHHFPALPSLSSAIHHKNFSHLFFPLLPPLFSQHLPGEDFLFHPIPFFTCSFSPHVFPLHIPSSAFLALHLHSPVHIMQFSPFYYVAALCPPLWRRLAALRAFCFTPISIPRASSQVCPRCCPSWSPRRSRSPRCRWSPSWGPSRPTQHLQQPQATADTGPSRGGELDRARLRVWWSKQCVSIKAVEEPHIWLTREICASYAQCLYRTNKHVKCLLLVLRSLKMSGLVNA